MQPEDMQDDDSDAILDHVALECMNAIESKDKDVFMQAFEVLVTDILDKFSDEMESKEE